MAMRPSLIRILIRSVMTTVIFTVIFGVYLAYSRTPDLHRQLVVSAAFCLAVTVLLERFVWPRLRV